MACTKVKGKSTRVKKDKPVEYVEIEDSIGKSNVFDMRIERKKMWDWDNPTPAMVEIAQLASQATYKSGMQAYEKALEMKRRELECLANKKENE